MLVQIIVPILLQAGLQKQLDKLEVAIASNKQKLDTVTAPRRTCRKVGHTDCTSVIL